MTLMVAVPLMLPGTFLLRPTKNICISISMMNLFTNIKTTVPLFHDLNLLIHETILLSPKCSEARGLGPDYYTEGIEMGSMDVLGDWTVEADQVIVY